ncbi:MAG: trans-sulfuration enzyme family protein [Myxococcota bacterium]
MTDDDQGRGPAVPPVVLSTTFPFPDVASMARAARTRDAYLYGRWANPTVEAVEDRLRRLEGAEAAIICGSGMAALSLGHLAAMGHGSDGGPRDGTLLVQREVYGGTHELAELLLPSFGLRVERAGIDDLAERAAELPAGSAVHVEVPTNPLIRVVDLDALREAMPDDAVLVVDATFASPVNLRALEHGADLVVHSASKYLGGHHDVVAGAMAGSKALVEAAWRLRKLLGPVLDPDAAYRLWRGMETLELRVARQNASAETLARRLDAHHAVVRVHHPGLPSHPDHVLAGRLLDGAGGVLSFEVEGGAEAASRVADALGRFRIAASLGGVRSLVSWPAGVSHVGLSEAERASSGVSAGLLRLALGTEPVEGLWADLEQALALVR